MKDLIITINSDTRKVVFNRDFIGLTGENLQGNIVVDFKDKTDFVDGLAYFEVEQDGKKYLLTMEKNTEDKTYKIPIKSSLLSSACKLKCQVTIHQEESDNGVPVFKSEIFQIPCHSSINATSTIPEDYPSWLEEANKKLIKIEEATEKANTILAELEEKEATGVVSNLQSLPTFVTVDSPDLVNLMDLYGNGVLYRKEAYMAGFDGSNLTNTTWKLPYPIDKGLGSGYAVNFTCKEYPDMSFFNIWCNTFDNGGNGVYKLTYASGDVAKWNSTAITINILGGKDVTNSEFINWLTTYANFKNEVQYRYVKVQDELTSGSGTKIENNVVSITKTDIIDNIESIPIASATSPDFVQKDGIIYYKKASTVINEETTTISYSYVEIGSGSSGSISGLVGVTQNELWTNPDDTIAFEPQTITLNSSDYDYLLFLYRDHAEKNRYSSIIIEKGKSTQLTLARSDTDFLLANNERKVNYISDTSLAFENNVTGLLDTNNKSQYYNPDNTALIPSKIIGIKFNSIYGWVDGKKTTITNTAIATETLIDISQFISDYIEGAEYEIIMHISVLNKAWNRIFIGTDIVTVYPYCEISSGYGTLRENIIMLPLNKFLKYYLNSATIEGFNIKLLAYRRIK